jgi:uncharacterized protein (DUF2141 family)
MRTLRNIICIAYLLHLISCARQTTPTGGPKDSIPPTLINSIPRHGQVNFSGKSIELTFSETVILNNPKEQLIITPGLEHDVDARAKKNQVTLTLEDDLQPNTTYTINFREAVQDITEKNPAEMLKLAFSTGSYLDSLSINGSVYDLLTGKELKDATVALFQSDTFNIFNHKPIYFTKTNDKGSFQIENLKPGSYFIYGIQDKNKNLIADSKTESYAFNSEPVELTTNVMGIPLPFVRLDSRPLKLTSARPDGTYFTIKTTKHLTAFQINSNDDEHIIASFGEDQSNIRIYNTFENKDSVAVKFTGTDSIRNSLDTTFFVKFNSRNVKPEPFEYSAEMLNVIGPKGMLEVKLKFNKPVLDLNFDSIFYAVDSLTKITFIQEDLKWDSLHNILTIHKFFDKSLLPKENPPSSTNRTGLTQPSKSKTPPKSSIANLFYFGQAAFISIELDSSKKITQTVVPTKLEDTGIIFAEIQTRFPYFILQLLDKDFKVIQYRRNLTKVSFEDLKPGDYQIRLIVDNNNDGRWTPGNFYTNEEPEPIAYYKNEKGIAVINLKANWELGPLLIKH